MDLKTVKSCFEKYVNHMEVVEKINSPENFEIDSISIQDIDRLTQIIFMDYTIKCSSRVNQTNVPCILYKHLNSLIRRYIQYDSEKKIDCLKELLLRLEDDNMKLKVNPISETNSKGWFF